MAEEKRYQGELTLIKIKDGADGASIEAVYDFFILSSSSESPAVPQTSLSVQEIIAQNDGWKLNIPTGLSEEYPYIWNFTRTEFNGKVNHSAPVIASFWAAAPKVKARYAAVQAPGENGWSETYNEKIHNYIIFSYDGGKTWEPVQDANNTDLNTLVGGIPIKGRVEVDEAAVIYSLVGSQDEILLFNDDGENIQEMVISPGTISFQVERQYLGMSDTMVFLEKEPQDEGTEGYVPRFSAGLISYSDLGTNIDLTAAISNIESIIESKEEKILIYDYNLNKIELNLSLLYKYSAEALSLVQTDKQIYSQAVVDVGRALLGTEGFLKTKITLTRNNKQEICEKNFPIRFASNYDLARLSIHANGITQSIRNTKLVFDGDGLTVKNGGIKIYKTNYQEVAVNGDTAFNTGSYYIETEEGYEVQTSYTPGLKYFVASDGEPVFYVDNFGNLQLKGNGQFSGTIYATDGIFSGCLKAASGYLENLLVAGELTIQGLEDSSPGIKLRGSYVRSTEEYDSSKENYYFYYNEKTNKFEPYTSAPGFEPTIYIKQEKPGIITTNFHIGETGHSDAGFYLDPSEGKIWASSIVLGNGVLINDRITFGNENGQRGEICNPVTYLGSFIRAFDDKSNPTLHITTSGIIYAGQYGVDTNQSNHIAIDGTRAVIESGNYSPGLRGWHIDTLNAEFNNIIARGTLRTSVFEYEEVSAIGGMVLVRPSALISNATFVKKEDGSDNLKQVILSLDTQQIKFGREDGSPYLFRIGTSAQTLGSGGVSSNDFSINEKTVYQLVEESAFSSGSGKNKTVTIEKKSGTDFKTADLIKFIGSVLIGYGRENVWENDELKTMGDIGIGLNSQSGKSSVLPNESISIFQTETKFNEKFGEYEFEEHPRIILGKMPDTLENNIYGLTGYGLYADNVNVKGELTSRTSQYYSGINSNSKVCEITPNEDGEYSQIVLWAGANVQGKVTQEQIAAAIQNAPFRVSLDGTVHANKGFFQGEIYGSTITASVLRTAEIEGYNTDTSQGQEVGPAALTIRDANIGIRFVSGRGSNEVEYFSLSKNEIKANMKLQAEEISTGSLVVSKNFGINNSLVRLGAYGEGDRNLSVLYKADWDVKDSETQRLAYFAESGFYAEKAVHLDGDIFFGGETMEYKKAYQGETKIQIGYDLFIKS